MFSRMNSMGSSFGFLLLRVLVVWQAGRGGVPTRVMPDWLGQVEVF